MRGNEPSTRGASSGPARSGTPLGVLTAVLLGAALLASGLLGTGLLLAVLGTAPAAAEDGGGDGPLWTTHTEGLSAVGLSSLRVHPKRPDVLFAHLRGVGPARSLDGGVTWEPLLEGLHPDHVPGPHDVCEISLDERNPATIWLVARGHVYWSETSGNRWEDRHSGALSSLSWDRRETVDMIRGLLVDPSKPVHILAGTQTDGRFQGGLYESLDSGKTWEQIAGSNLPDSELEYDAWPILLDPRTDKNVAVVGAGSFWRSDDRGRTFKRSDPGEAGDHDIRSVTRMGDRGREIFLCDQRGVWHTRDGGKRWDREPILAGDAIVVARDPGSRNRVFAYLRDRGLLVSSDSRNAKWTELGLQGEHIKELLVHPRDNDVVFAASPITGLFRSTDQGETFEKVEATIEPIVPRLDDVAFHPLQPDIAMAIGEDGLLFRSEDRGETWARLQSLGMHARKLVAGSVPGEGDERTPTWFVAGHDLLKSADGGETWEVAYAPLDSEEQVIDVVSDGADHVWLLLERSGTVVRSDNAGETWALMEPPTKSSGTRARKLAVDRDHPDHLLLATRTRRHLWVPRDEDGGAFESWDGGETWTPLRNGLSKGSAPQRNWNYGSHASIDTGSGLQFYGADGLGLFARIMPGGDGPRGGDEGKWVAIGPTVEAPVFGVALLRPKPHGEGTEMVLQVHGANNAREFVRADVADLLARVKLGMADMEPQDDKPLWTSMPDPGVRLTSLAQDPLLPERMLGTAEGGGGVYAFGVPGAVPEPPEPPAPEPVPPAPAGPTVWSFTAGADGGVQAWQAGGVGLPDALSGHTGAVNTVDLSLDGRLVATGSEDGSVRVWNALDGKPGIVLPGVELPEGGVASVLEVAFSPKRLFVVRAGTDMASATVLSYPIDALGGTDVQAALAGAVPLDGSAIGAPSALALSADGATLALGGADGGLRGWRVGGDFPSTLWETPLGSAVHAVAMDPDGSRAYAGLEDGSVVAVGVADGGVATKAALPGGGVSDLILAGDTLFASGEGGAFALSPTDLSVTLAYTGPTAAIDGLALSPDGTWLLGGDADGGVWMWKVGEATATWTRSGAHAGGVRALCAGRRPAPSAGAPGEGAPAEGAPEDAPAAPEAPEGDGSGLPDGGDPEGGGASPEPAPAGPDDGIHGWQ